MEETLAARWARRAVTFPGYLFAWLLLVAGLPLWLPLAAATDLLLRRRLAATRFLSFLLVYLGCEIAGLLACFAIWVPRALRLVTRERFLDWNFRLQCRWAGALFGAAQRIYRLQVAIDGEAGIHKGPVLIFIRHASLIDTLLPAALLSARNGLRLRYVLKRELLLDPCLDVVGQRLPNAFVRRDARDSEREIAIIRTLARGLGPDEGLLIYPEGTRFTKAKRASALERLSRSSRPELAERGARLRYLLPPRLGGPLALLEVCRGADVVLFGHVGFEGLTRPRHLWDGSLLERRIAARFWRIPTADIPAGEEDRIAWLYEGWEILDGWVADQARGSD